MFGIKRIDKFVFNSFFLLFIGNFLVSLFVFMMQFLWKYVDDLVGKGLSLTVLGKFFFYSGLTCVPASLPLAILLTSLITFGNFGERYELLAMKAAGIPLIRIMRPLMIFSFIMIFVSFYFQNVMAPIAQKQLGNLYLSIKQKTPELAIPENVFSSEINNINIRVGKKNPKTGLLYDVLIYNFKDGFENANITYADSGRMEITADKKHLVLYLYSGDLFENLKSQEASSKNVPYRRESFKSKKFLVEYNSEFEMTTSDIMSGQSSVKNMKVLTTAIDSMKVVADSIGNKFYRDLTEGSLRVEEWRSCEEGATEQKIPNLAKYNTDSIYRSLSLQDKQRVLDIATNRVSSEKSDLSMKNYQVDTNNYNLRKHKIEWHKKITISLSCLIFLFIGAPLGAIIRKGGLGLPVVLSVLIFIIYYIIDSTGYKLARDNVWIVWVGMWFSTAILLPFGAFLTYKSNKDAFNIADNKISVIFNTIKDRISRRNKKNNINT